MAKLKISDLQPNKKNPRTMSERAMSGLKVSVKAFGDISGITWNKRTRTLVTGHQRLEALKKQYGEDALKLEEDVVVTPTGARFPVRVVDWDDAFARAAMVTANNQQIAGEFDGTVSELVADLPQAIGNLFGGLNFDDMLAKLPGSEQALKEGLTDPDAIPEEPAELRTSPGDIWLLGAHRLMCGDSTNKEDMDLLFNGARPELMITDPPYGVKYDPSWRNDALKKATKTERLGKVENDDRASWAMAYSLFSGDVAYVWHASGFCNDVDRSLKACGFLNRSQIIWVKSHFVLSRGEYHFRHECCWYGVRKGGKSKWVGNRKQQTIWADIVDHWTPNENLFAAKIDEKTLMAFDASSTTIWEISASKEVKTIHGTQKPVECMARPIRNHNVRAVYDPFIGSGTTIIAAEQLGRSAYGMEITPRYCDIAVRRWEEFTGLKAKLVVKRSLRKP